jgi:hypothetical protein
MPRNVTVTLSNGTRHVYANVPDNATPGIVLARAAKDFAGVHVTNIDGGRADAPVALRPTPNRPVARQSQPTRDQQITAAGRALGNRTQGGSDTGISYAASLSRNLFGIPERLAAAGERWLPSSITGNTSNASYSDILHFIRAKTDAEMHRSTTGNVIGTIVGGTAGGRAVAGAVGAVANRAAAAASPLISRAGNVLQNLVTMQKGRRVANAARVVAAGAGGGAAQAAGEGSNVAKGAAYGAAGAAALGTGFKAAQVVTRPFRDFLRLSSAGQLLSRLTTATTEQLTRRANAYRQATGAEPTLFELLPLADRNKILKQAVVGRDSVVEATSTAIRRRANNLGPEMSARARQILEPARTALHGQLVNDLRTARGGRLAPGDHDLAERASSNPTDMSEFRDTEARAIMAPHDDTPVSDNFNDILPQHPQQTGKGKKATISMVDSDPAVTAAIRSVAPGGYRAGTSGENPAQPVTVGDISSMIEKLRGDIGKGGIDGRTAERAIAHLEGELGARAPEAAAAHAQMTDAYASRSRMMEGMQEGSATRLRDEVQVGTSRRQARTVRNAYDTPEGDAGRTLGQGNKILTSLEGSPEEALRSTVGISRNSTGRQLSQNLGPEPAEQIGAAARAQDESAQALAAASQKAQSGGGDSANAETLVQAIAGLHPSSFITTKTGAIRKLIDMTYIPENRARTIVDMIFSQDPKMVQRAINAVGDTANGSRFLQYLGGVTGTATASSGQAGGQEAPPPAAPAPEPSPPVVEDPNAAPVAEPGAEPVDPSQSPYAMNLQQLEASENPDLLALINRQFNQESGGHQFGPDGKPLTSSAGAVGTAQVMPHTGPEAAADAGLPWDETAYRADPVYNRLLGIGYMSKLLRKHDGDVARALASYNAGPDRVDHALAAGDNWLTRLPPETQDYVQRIAG